MILTQSVHETGKQKSARIAANCLQSILARIEDPILSTEFVLFLENEPTGTRQRVEDEALVKLYRGYDAQTAVLWV